jgi:hypothetical protein
VVLNNCTLAPWLLELNQDSLNLDFGLVRRRLMKASPGVLLIIILTFASTALATDFFTSSTGSDVSNDCKSIKSPCNLANGLLYEFSQVTAANGDTIYMCAGACDGAGSAALDIAVNTAAAYWHNIPSGTSRSNAMTIMPYPGESITWRPTSGSTITIHDGTHYTTWKNFTLDGSATSTSTGYGVYLGSTTDYGDNGYHRFENMTVENWPQTGFFTTCPGNQFINNIVRNNARGTLNCSAAPHGYYISGNTNVTRTSDNTLIDGGEIYGQLSDSCYGVYAIQIYHNAGAGQYPSNNVIIRNVNAHNNNQGILVTGGTGNLAYNNLSYNNTYNGLIAYSVGNVSFFNNTVFGNGYYAAQNSTTGTAVFRNNIFWNNLHDGIEVTKGSPIQSNNLTSDPLFVNPSEKNFHLLKTSPAIATGSNLSTVFTSDNEGNKRPSSGSWAIGAYENGPLSAPRNLTSVRVQ